MLHFVTDIRSKTGGIKVERSSNLNVSGFKTVEQQSKSFSVCRFWTRGMVRETSCINNNLFLDECQLHHCQKDCRKMYNLLKTAGESISCNNLSRSVVLSGDQTGMDYTGASSIRTHNGSYSTRKVYVVLFTYAVTRAILLKVVDDLAGSGVFKVFHRFYGYRSYP